MPRLYVLDFDAAPEAVDFIRQLTESPVLVLPGAPAGVAAPAAEEEIEEEEIEEAVVAPARITAAGMLRELNCNGRKVWSALLRTEAGTLSTTELAEKAGLARSALPGTIRHIRFTARRHGVADPIDIYRWTNWRFSRTESYYKVDRCNFGTPPPLKG